MTSRALFTFFTSALVGLTTFACSGTPQDEDLAATQAGSAAIEEADDQWIVACDHLRANANWDGCSARSDSQACVYTANPGWVIVDHRVEVHSSSNGSREIQFLSEGTEYSSETILQDVYEASARLAASYGDTNLKAEIEAKGRQHLEEVRRYKTNKNTLAVTARARAHGSCVDRKRGWDESTVHVRIHRVGPKTQDDAVSFVARRFGQSEDAVRRELRTDASPSGRFAFSKSGPLAGMHCIVVDEPSDPDTWNDNTFCADKDYGFRWSYAGPIAGMRCTQVVEPSDPHAWNDNFLCVPEGSPLSLEWSYAGPVAGADNLRWNEPSDPHAWNDNFLGIRFR